MEEKTTSGVAWAALVISIVALILGWAAFNRSGRNVEDVVIQEVQQAEDVIREEGGEALINAGEDLSTDD